MSSSKKSGFTVKEFLVVVAIVAAFFLLRMYKKSGEEFQPAPQVQSEPAKSNVNPAVPDQALTPKPSEASPAAGPEAPVIQRQGLCRYGEQTPHIHWKLVRHLSNRKPSLFILPKYQSKCLSRQTEFAVVDYDPSTDLGFDYFGEFEMRIEPAGSYPSIQDFSQVNSDRLKEFGFETFPELLKWLNEMGPPDQEMTVFKVQRLGKFSIRNPTGTYTKYPGVRLLNPTEVEDALKKDSSLRIIDMRISGPQLKWSNVKKAPVQNLTTTLSPLVALNQWKSLKEDLKIDLNSNFLLVGDSEGDKRPFGWAGALPALGAKEIRVLKGGVPEAGQPPEETPKTFSEVEAISLARFLEMAPNSVIVDTRGVTSRQEGIAIKKAVRISVDKKMFNGQGGNAMKEIKEGLISGQLDPKYDIFQKPKFSKHLEQLNSKKVILIGKDDFDWTPLLVAASLKKHIKAEVYWYRAGYTSLEIFKKVGQPMAGLEDRFKKIKKFKKVTVQSKTLAPRMAKSAVVLQPKGITRIMAAAKKENKEGKGVAKTEVDDSQKRRRFKQIKPQENLN